MKLFIYIFKFTIFTFYLLPLIPQFITLSIINICSNLLPPLGHNKPEWIIKLNTYFIYFTSNILLRNHTNNFLIYFIIKLQKVILNFGINTGLTLCRSQSIHANQGLLLKFQAYPQPLEFYNVYFAIWFTLIQEPKFLNNDITQIFICTMFSSLIWDKTDKASVGDYRFGLCNLISDLKTPFAIKMSEWFTLHSNFTWTAETTIIEFINAIIPYHDKLISSKNSSSFQIPWINEVHVTTWKVNDQLNKSLINREQFKHFREIKNMMR